MSKFKDLFAKLLRIRKVLIGIDKYIKQDVTLPITTYGNPNADWTLVTDLLNEASVVYSFGVGDDISFDLCVINHFDLQIYAFDPTPKSVEWVSTQSLPKQFMLNPVGLANYNGKAKFHPPKDPNHISATILDREDTKNQAYKVEVRTLKSIMEELGHRQIDLLKMNIAGAEYDVIENMKEDGIKPSQILIVFHHRFENIGIEKTVDAVKTLRDLGYKVYYVSKTGEEIAFIREELIEKIPTLREKVES